MSSACSTACGPASASRSGSSRSQSTSAHGARVAARPGSPAPSRSSGPTSSLPATVLSGYVAARVLGHAHVGRPIPALVLPLILFMGVHEYSLARGAAVAFVLGYATDVLGIAPVGLYTFTYVATFVLARAAGVRLAAQTTLDAGAAGRRLRAPSEHDGPRAPRHLRARRVGAALALPAGAAARDRHRGRSRPLVFRLAQAIHAADRGATRAEPVRERRDDATLLVAALRRRRVPQALQVDGAVRVARVPRGHRCASFQLQIVDGAEYAAIAHENIIRRVSRCRRRAE